MALPLEILAYGSQMKKNVVFGMHVNLVYQVFDAKEQEETKIEEKKLF